MATLALGAHGAGKTPATAASSESGVARVKARGAVHCGAFERPALAEVDGSGKWRGLEVDICRAVAFVVLGSADQVVFDGYESHDDYNRVRNNEDDLFFLSGREIALNKLAGAVLPGPTVYVASVGVMVPGNSPVKHMAELAGRGVCFHVGDIAESSLEEYFDSMDTPWLRHPYSERGEMNDAYAVQRCHAIAGETTELARTRLYAGPERLRSRILPETLSVFPIIAATGVHDGRWSSLVSWIINTLITAERPQRKWFAGGAGAMPIAAGDFGLPDGWQERVVNTIGHYGAIYERNVGAGGPYRLERGFSANQLQGGVMLAPFVE